MGVINLSAESSVPGKRLPDPDQAVQRGKVLHAQGAHIIDLGAESSLAHAARVDESSQQSMLIPVLRELRKADILVSVETYHPSVTQACLEAGANVLNLTGTHATSEIYRMVADHDAAVIICFVQGPNVRDVGELVFKGDFMSVLYEFFSREIETALARDWKRSLSIREWVSTTGTCKIARNAFDIKCRPF